MTCGWGSKKESAAESGRTSGWREHAFTADWGPRDVPSPVRQYPPHSVNENILVLPVSPKESRHLYMCRSVSRTVEFDLAELSLSVSRVGDPDPAEVRELGHHSCTGNSRRTCQTRHTHVPIKPPSSPSARPASQPTSTRPCDSDTG